METEEKIKISPNVDKQVAEIVNKYSEAANAMEIKKDAYVNLPP